MGELPELKGKTILQVAPELSAGGVERTVLEVTEAIVDAGGRALLASKGGRLEAEFARLGGQLFRMDAKSRNPLILKVNAKTDIPSSAHAFSACNASVEDAVRLGADAIGYTLYVGSPRQDEDLAQLREVREDCDRFGMPLVIWSYPRGEAIDAKGGATSFYAIDYAARLAMEMGADVVKINMPTINPEKYRDA